LFGLLSRNVGALALARQLTFEVANFRAQLLDLTLVVVGSQGRTPSAVGAAAARRAAFAPRSSIARGAVTSPDEGDCHARRAGTLAN
jgi:hypothetical protein